MDLDEHLSVLQSVIDGSKYIVSNSSNIPFNIETDILTDRTKGRKDPSWEANSDVRLHPDAIAKVGMFLFRCGGVCVRIDHAS